MAGIICIDFDNTVVVEDVAASILDQFAGPACEELHARRRAGQMTLEEYSAAAIDLVEATEDELVRHALDVATPRKGLLELWDWAHWNGWQAAIVSNGWDVYINPVLDRLGVERMARHCGRARYLYRWRLRYLSPRGVEVTDRFKVGYAAAFKELGDALVWVGDGPSDRPPAEMSDAVFARDHLLDALNGERERVYAFEDFGDVVAVLEREGDRWLESFSSTTAAAD